MIERYELLTTRWLLGYDSTRIVAFAAQCGHVFTESELDYVRLTNRKTGSDTHCSIDDFSDYSPMAQPQMPADARLFLEWHGRDAG